MLAIRSLQRRAHCHFVLCHVATMRLPVTVLLETNLLLYMEVTLQN